MRPSVGSDVGFLLALEAAGQWTLDKILDKRQLHREGPCANKLTM